MPISIGRSPLLATNKFVIAAVAVLALLGGVAIDRFVLSPRASAPAEESEAPHNELVLDDTRIANAGIGFLRVEAGSAADQIIAQATVAATPEGAAIIGARADGTVTQLHKRLGDVVRKGESIGAIQSREAARLAGERAAASARLFQAEHAFQRQRSLMEAGATSRQNFDAAQSEWRVAQAELSRANAASGASGVSGDGVSLNILSPISGRITAASAVLGSYVVAGTELFRVADPSKLEVQAAVPSADVPRIAVGDRAMIDLPQGPVRAIVRAITPDVNLQSRAATVVLTPQADAKVLQPGQLVSARIMVAHGHADTKTVLVPTEAVQHIEGSDAVFVRTKTGFRVTRAVIGTENGGMTEVRFGLKAGDQIATRNAFLLKAELQKGSGGND